MMNRFMFYLICQGTNMNLQFELPANLTAEKLLEKLSQRLDINVFSYQHALKTFYDSFDWRLYSKGISCEFDRSKCGAILTLMAINNNVVIASTELDEVPMFAKYLAEGSIRDVLIPILEMRALLAICTLEYEVYQFEVRNKKQNLVLNARIEVYDLYNSRLFLYPVKGYNKYAKKLSDIVIDKLDLIEADQSVLLSALKLMGRKPKEYSSKLNIKLNPDMHTDVASKKIYSHLLKVIKANEQGVIADIDSEFLHNFRVAIRRTRAGLSQFKSILSTEVYLRFVEFFSWLGQITNAARDLDVYLLNFDSYRQSLPIELRNDLDPLYALLVQKKTEAHKALVENLNSDKYYQGLAQWEWFLEEKYPKKPAEPKAKLHIKEFADRKITRMYQSVLHEGQVITLQSPAEALHHLRKTNKKLRYLLDFFNGLYSEKKLKPVVKVLKDLQEVLGTYQDCYILQLSLKHYMQELSVAGVSDNTLLAMESLITNIEQQKNQARTRFTKKFKAFQKLEKTLKSVV
jgi:CHAD domain-containing protein